MRRSRRWLKTWLIATSVASAVLSQVPNLSIACEGRTQFSGGPSCYFVHDLEVPPQHGLPVGFGMMPKPQQVNQIAPNPVPIPNPFQAMLDRSLEWMKGVEFSLPFSRVAESETVDSFPSCDLAMEALASDTGEDSSQMSGCTEAIAMSQGYEGWMTASPSTGYARSFLEEEYFPYDVTAREFQWRPNIVFVTPGISAFVQERNEIAELAVDTTEHPIDWNAIWDEWLAADQKGLKLPAETGRLVQEESQALPGLGCLSPELDSMFVSKTDLQVDQVDDDADKVTPLPAGHMVRLPRSESPRLGQTLHGMAKLLQDWSIKLDQYADYLSVH